MALINKEPVNAELLKSDRIVLAALVVELGKPCLQRFPGALHLLNRVTFRLLRLGLLDPSQDFLNLALQNGLLALQAHGDFLKLAVADDDSVVVPGGNAAAKLLAVLGFKVFLCRYQDVGRRIELEPFRRPLLRDVIGHHDQRLGAKPQAFHLHGGGHHLVSFPCPHLVGQQGIPAVQDVCDGVHLVGPQGNLRVHPLEPDMPPVILAGADAVEGFIVNAAQQLPAVNIFPYPLGKLLLNQFLPVLGNRGFFFVEDGLFLAVLVLNIIEYPHIPLI